MEAQAIVKRDDQVEINLSDENDESRQISAEADQLDSDDDVGPGLGLQMNQNKDFGNKNMFSQQKYEPQI